MRHAAALAVLLLASPSAAQTAWPTRAVSIVVPYVAGGPSDILARALAARLQADLGQAFVAENRPGANGAVAAQLVARAPADGHTLFIGASGIMTVAPALRSNLPYDPIRDFAPITVAISAPNVLVATPSLPVTDLPSLIAWAKANPDRASYGTSGIGSSEHLGMEMLKQIAGFEATHIPYSGGAGSIADLLSGNLALGMLNIGTVRPHIESGRLKAIAVGSLTRYQLLPNVATFVDGGLAGFETGSWHSIVAPKGTPAPVIVAIHAAIIKALADPDVATRLAAVGFTIEGGTPDALAELIPREIARWRGVIQAAKITVE